MFALGKVLEEGDTLYIKCIRPNTKNLPKLFDYHYVKVLCFCFCFSYYLISLLLTKSTDDVQEQIKWNGVVETLKLVQKGYPVHFRFSKFYARSQTFLQYKRTQPQSLNYKLLEILL
jgi:myosin heavy subunit